MQTTSDSFPELETQVFRVQRPFKAIYLVYRQLGISNQPIPPGLFVKPPLSPSLPLPLPLTLCVSEPFCLFEPVPNNARSMHFRASIWHLGIIPKEKKIQFSFSNSVQYRPTNA